MGNLRDVLDSKLLAQPFAASSAVDLQLQQAKSNAELYTRLENGMSVLSDLRARKSYIYYGLTAQQLGLVQKGTEIDSIWEDDLLNRIHPDDLQKKYRLELQFFQLLNTLDAEERLHYEVITRLRTRNAKGIYVLLQHRLLYIGSWADGSIWLALCLYNRVYDHLGFTIPEGVIIDKRTGALMEYNEGTVTDILSAREKEILKLAKYGSRSKEIADRLSLSIHTVNRHRQNIFQKLGVTNVLEACRIADGAGLL